MNRGAKTYLVLTPLTPVCTLYVHYKNVHVPAPTHPDT